MVKMEQVNSAVRDEIEHAESEELQRNMINMEDSDCAVWEAIEQAESYLVCSMYSLAASSASSILKQIDQNFLHLSADELYTVRESAGMVLVQSMKETGRASMIVDELKLFFHLVESIPIQVLVTGVCFQISEGSTTGVREFLEEFLEKWSNVDEQRYRIVGVDSNKGLSEGTASSFSLGIEEYMEVVEIYVVTVLGTVCNDVKLAISWTEKAALPEERKQALLRKLHSLCSLTATSESQGSSSEIPKFSDEHANYTSGGSLATLNGGNFIKGMNHQKQAIVKLPAMPNTCWWWFGSLTLRFGDSRLAISNGRVLLGSLIFIVLYVLRRKKASVQGILRRQFGSMRKALVDLWQLAFSYQTMVWPQYQGFRSRRSKHERNQLKLSTKNIKIAARALGAWRDGKGLAPFGLRTQD